MTYPPLCENTGFLTDSTPALATAQLLAEKIRTRRARVGVVGLGYVGLPLAVEFAAAGFTVTGIDISEEKVRRVNAGDSYVGDIPSATLERYGLQVRAIQEWEQGRRKPEPAVRAYMIVIKNQPTAVRKALTVG